MKKNKSVKKFLSIGLACCTLFQSGLICHEIHAEAPKTATSAKVLGSIGGVAILGLTAAVIVEKIMIDNQEVMLSWLYEDSKDKKQRIDVLEANLREYHGDIEHTCYSEAQIEALSRETAKDCMNMLGALEDDHTLNELIESLKFYHPTGITEGYIANVLRATIRHSSELKARNVKPWLKDCGIERISFENITKFVFGSDLRDIFKFLRNWEYQNKVNNSLEKNRFLDLICKILSA